MLRPTSLPRMLSVLLTLAWVWLPASLLAEPLTAMRFVRDPGHEALQTAILSFQGPKGATVDLVAAVHVGDAAYYTALEQRFGAYQKVLYELVKPEEMDIA